MCLLFIAVKKAYFPLFQHQRKDDKRLGKIELSIPCRNMATDGSGTIAVGGVSQDLFATLPGKVPVNGFEVINPDPTEDMWITDSASAALAIWFLIKTIPKKPPLQPSAPPKKSYTSRTANGYKFTDSSLLNDSLIS